MPWKTLEPEIKSAEVLRNDVLYGPRGFTYPKHLIMRNLTQTCISLFSITLFENINLVQMLTTTYEGTFIHERDIYRIREYDEQTFVIK